MGSKSGQPLLEEGIVLNGKWEIVEHIGTGGMAEVYRARQINLDREVAIKIISQELLASFEGDEEEIRIARERFQREVKVMAQVRHLNVLQVYDYDRVVLQKNGKELLVEYLAMEYVPGPNLRFTMPPEGLRDSEKGIREWIRKYFLPILDGVETVNALGIVHRDIKPENVLLDGSIPKIMDFGLACGPHWRGLTRNYHTGGTIPYMAPEQFIDMCVTEVRADIYSLGKILYEAISGKMERETAFPFKTAHLSDPDTPFLKRMDRVIQQATAEDKKQRIPSVGLFRQALMGVLEEAEKPAFRLRAPSRGFPIWRPRPLMAILVVILAASIGFHIFYHRKMTSVSPPMQPPLTGPIQGPVPQQPETTTQTEYVVLEVRNMTCTACTVVTRDSLARLDGVKEAKVTLNPPEAVVVFNPDKVKVEDLIKATTNVGYPSLVKQEKAGTYLKFPEGEFGRSAEGTKPERLRNVEP